MHKPLALAVLLLTLSSPAWAQQFEDQDGYVLIEMESTPIPGDSEWTEESDLMGAEGSYYTFTGNGICSGPANDPLRYTFRIRESGTWELRLRAAKRHHCVQGQPHNNNRCEENDRTCTSLGFPQGDDCGAPDQCIRTDISNDAFVHIETASGDYVAFIDQPGGSVGNPIKLFGGGNESWGWTGRRALDTNGRKFETKWELPAGEYALVIHGRSQQFRIDRVALLADGSSTREADGRAETRATPTPPMDMTPDMPAPSEDMSQDMTSMPDMPEPSEDMASPTPDMAPSRDMTPAQDMTPEDMTTTPPTDPGATDDGCAVGVGGAPAGAGWGWLGVLLLGWRRRS